MTREKQTINPAFGYYDIFSKLMAIKNCRESNNTEWEEKHTDHLKEILLEHLPYGSGFNGEWDFEFVTDTKTPHILCSNCFDTMDEEGYWGPSIDFTIKIVNEDNIQVKGFFSEFHGKFYWLKDYIYEWVVSYHLQELFNKNIFSNYHYYKFNERYQLGEPDGK